MNTLYEQLINSPRLTNVLWHTYKENDNNQTLFWELINYHKILNSKYDTGNDEDDKFKREGILYFEDVLLTAVKQFKR